MARIPDKYSLSAQGSLRSGRTIASYDTSGLTRGIQGLAAGLSDLSGAMVQEEAEKRRKDTIVGAALSDADYTTSALDIENKADADPDYEKAPAKYGAELDKALNRSAESIKDPEARAQWIALKRDDLARQKDALVDRSTKRRDSARIVQLDTSLEKYRRIYVDPTTSEDAKEKARADIEGTIQMAEQGGLLTPELGADKRFKYLEEADYSRGLMEVERNPDIISKPLPSNVSQRSKDAMGYFESRGWTKAQAAGIVGNLLAESSLNTDANNPGDGSDGSDSIGIAQWNGDRAKALKKFAAMNHADWRDFGVQLAFVDHELNTSHKSIGDNLRKAGDVQGATDVAVMFEGPRGSNKGARFAHNYKGRLNYALQAAGEKVNPDWYDRISPEAREKINNVADAQEKAFEAQRVAEAKAFQQQARDDFNLQIATNPARVTQQEILNNPDLDNGDKATLINSLNSAMKENAGVNEFINALGAGETVSINPFDKDQTKIADKAFDQMLAAAPEDQRPLVTSAVISQTGYIPEKVQAEIRRGLISSSVPEMAAALTTTDAIARLAPNSIASMNGHEKVEKNLTAYRHFAFDMGYSPEEAARKVISLNDPAMAAQRDAIMKSKPIADTIKAVDASTVADLFDTATSWQPGLGDAPTQQELSVGYTPESEAAIVEDYRSMLEEGIADAGGDTDLGKKMADERFKRLYGTSGLTLAGGESVVKLPPEKAYPADINGSYDYIREQALEDLKSEGINATEVYLQPFEQTERDVSAGRPANYQLFYMQDGKFNKFQHPFTADPAKASKAALENSRAKQQENRAIAAEDNKLFDAIRAARSEAEAQYQDYPETFRMLKMREAEQTVRDQFMESEQ